MGSAVTSSWVADLLIAALFAVWVIVLVDIVRQPRRSTRAKIVWVVLCTLVWPLLVVYWITRPVQGRSERAADHSSPRARLVDAVLDHEDRGIDDQQMAQIVGELRAQ